MRPSFLLALILIGYAARADLARADLAQEATDNSDIVMSITLDSTEQSGNASATVVIHASREVVWSLITSCAESLRMVPGLEVCAVQETAPDRSWQKILHVMHYSWFMPKVTYEILAVYVQPSKVSFERISGDLRTLRGSWILTREGENTVARYTLDLAPGFWVPHWMVRTALGHDLPKMLRALRTRAEEIQKQKDR